MLFEAIVLSQLLEANSRNRAIDRSERGTFWDDLADFANEVDREERRSKKENKKRPVKKESTDGLPKYDKSSDLWINVETGEVID